MLPRFSRNVVKNTISNSVARSFSKEAAKEAVPKVAPPKQAPPKSGGSAIYVFLAATACFVYADPFDLKEVKQLKAQLGLLKVDIPLIKNDIKALIDEVDAARGDGTGIGPTLVRLAWHAAGTYSKDGTGGSNGSHMRMSPEKDWGANAGLGIARDVMQKIKDKHPHVSIADLWTLAGVTAIEHMGGPSIPWRQGRSDSDKPTTVPDGRLPAADKGDAKKTNSGIRDTFYRMGFNDQEIVALSGAHALGRCHTDASGIIIIIIIIIIIGIIISSLLLLSSLGYWGPWTRAETTFSNEYFR